MILTPSSLLFTLKLLIAALAVKSIPSLLYVLNGVPWRQALTMGVLLSSRLSLIIVAATIGLEMEFITPRFKDAIILLVVMTCLLGLSIFRLPHRQVEKV